MKTAYINTFLAFLFLGFSCKAQETIIDLGNKYNIDPNTPAQEVIYYKDLNNVLDKFEGTWLFDDGTHFVQIEVTKFLHTDLYGSNDFDDVLFLKMEYRLNGVEQYNYDTTLGISGNTLNNSDTVVLYYKEPSLISCERRKEADLILEHTGSVPNEQLIWTRIDTIVEGFSGLTCPDGSEIDDSDFIVPTNMTLTKQ